MAKSSDIERVGIRRLGRLAWYYQYDWRAVTAVAVLILMTFNLLVGQDANWDTRNYHYPAAYQLLQRGWYADLAPSQRQTWINPVVYLPAYWLINSLPPIVASLVLSFFQALSAPLVYLIAQRVLVTSSAEWRRVQSLACVAVALTGSAFLCEVGTTFSDSLLAIPFLGAILLVLQQSSSVDDDMWRSKKLVFFSAGFLIGLGVGAKLTCAVFAIAFLLAWIWYAGRRWLPTSLLIGLGMIGGGLFSGGWWLLSVWQHFGNPIFPMANGIFRSAWLGSGFLDDTRFLGSSWTDVIVYPLRMVTGGGPVAGDVGQFVGAEGYFRDARYLVGFVTSTILTLLALVSFRKQRDLRSPLHFLGMFWLISFLIWFHLFGIIRYTVILELLSGALVIGAVSHAVHGREKIAGFISLIGAVILILSTYPPTFGHERFAGTWFGLGDLATLSSPGTVVVMTNGDPVAYVQPFLPESVRFVRIGGNLPIRRGSGLGDRAAEIIGSARGPLRSLREADAEDESASLAHFALKPVDGSCEPIPAKVTPLVSCALERVKPSR